VWNGVGRVVSPSQIISPLVQTAFLLLLLMPFLLTPSAAPLLTGIAQGGQLAASGKAIGMRNGLTKKSRHLVGAGCCKLIA
jgi:hypothetical protein